jgi:hypothetical protein
MLICCLHVLFSNMIPGLQPLLYLHDFLHDENQLKYLLLYQGAIQYNVTQFYSYAIITKE